MKTIQFFIAILLISLSTNAQITKGNWMMGGSGSFNYSKTEPKTTSTSGTTLVYSTNGTYTTLLEPNIGYFIKDKFSIGMKINFLNAFVENQPFSLNESNISISPNIRYYFLAVDKNYNLFVEPSYYYYMNKSLGNANGYGLKSGFVVFLNSSVGIEPTLNYLHNESDKFIKNDFFIGIGFQIHLEKK